MATKCAKCNKTVYPAEQLKCLDKDWHKMCFKCTECNMTLNMKNYKGFNKLPYCNAHYPQLKATVVADTPEMKRCDQLSKQQSQVEYHREYEATKGNVTSIADDPEMTRARQMSNVISHAAYAGRGQDADSGETSYTRPMRSSTGDGDDIQVVSERAPYVPASPMGRMLPLPGQQPYAAAPPPPQQPPASSGPRYIALYDYDAQDEDEASFVENDVILNCQIVDDGWVIGFVERTGQRGMIPSNYIEQQ